MPAGDASPARNTPNDAVVIHETVKRLAAFCSEVVHLNIKLVFVNAGSTDRRLALELGAGQVFRRNDSMLVLNIAGDS
jgi:hypothetical protein